MSNIAKTTTEETRGGRQKQTTTYLSKQKQERLYEEAVVDTFTPQHTNRTKTTKKPSFTTQTVGAHGVSSEIRSFEGVQFSLTLEINHPRAKGDPLSC